MRIFELHEEQWLPTTMENAWKFFSSPDNLAVITPPDLDFVVTSKSLAPEIFAGMVIRYYLRPLFGIRVTWETEIRMVRKPFEFIDVQAKGPYKLWEHHHTFAEKDGGVLVTDHVRYALPFGMLGNIAQKVLVKNRLKKIFDFRKKTLSEIFKA